MTKFESSQQDIAFINAGKRAFFMNITVYHNPYKEQPYHDYWERGWRIAKKRDNKNGKFNQRTKAPLASTQSR